MTINNQSADYYRIMRSNLDDKRKMLESLPPGARTVLDVGGGDGVLAEVLLDEGIETTVVDASPESVARVNALRRVQAVEAYADELHKAPNFGSVDAVIASSVVHEIFSYGNATQHAGKIANVIHFLKSAYAALRDGGRLVVRDGVSGDRMRIGNMVLPVKFADDALRFQERSPFFGERAEGKDRSIYFTRIAGDVYTGTHSSLTEFLFTWTWGAGSFEREVQEYLTVFTLEEFTVLAESVGFHRKYAEQYVQAGYREAIESKGVSLDFPFPYTKAIWVLEK